jgi:cystathionine gamma-synthase
MRNCNAIIPGKTQYPSEEEEKDSNPLCRFFQHACVRQLNNAVLARIGAPENIRCMIFPSQDGMARCAKFLRTKAEGQIREDCFGLNERFVSEASKENTKWARFYAVLFPEQLTDAANEFWGFLGDGISSRHAVFCLERFSFMDSVSTDLSFKTLATSHDIEKIHSEPWNHSDAATKQEIRTMIAGLVTSQKPNQEAVKTQDVFLYPKGMCAIGSVARQLVPVSSEASEAVVFG